MNAERLKQRKYSVLPILLVFRILNALSTKTFFQADEFWQALEPAHLKAFGYGQLTWEWEYGLRSYAFPFIFELTYRSVKLTARLLDFSLQLMTNMVIQVVSCVSSDPQWPPIQKISHIPSEFSDIFEYHGVVYAPKVVMAIIAAVGEFFTIRLVQKLYLLTLDKSKNEKGNQISQVSKYAMILTSSNFFNCFLITRPFVNSFEMVLTSIALFYWDWSGGFCIQSSDFAKSLFFASFACLQRPSNALIWATLGGFIIINLTRQRKYSKLLYLLYKVFVSFASTLALNIIIDYYFYRKPVLPVLRFLKFNFTSSLSDFYGTSPWYFHITQSVPIILGLSIPLFVYGYIVPLSSKTFSNSLVNPLIQIKMVIVVTLIAFSSLPHKEFRFIYPLQPLFTLISSLSLLQLAIICQIRSKIMINMLWGLPFASIFAAFLLNSFNESGTVAVMKLLHQEPAIESIGFIMPCHSTPWQSYLHRNDIKELWAITCDPPLHLLDDPNARNKLTQYMDESDYLYDDIPGFIYQNFPPVFRKSLRSPGKKYRHEWPEYLVIFEHLKDAYFDSLLKDSSYVEKFRLFNSFSHWDSRRRGDVLVYRKTIDR